MPSGENGMLKQLSWGPSAQVKSMECPSWRPLRFIKQSKAVAFWLLTGGLQCHAEVEKRFPEDNPIHHVQRMLCSLIFLQLYHKYSIICIRNNICREGLKTISNQLDKQIQLYPFHRGRGCVLNESNTTSFLWSWKSLTYRSCNSSVCFWNIVTQAGKAPWEPVVNQEYWEERHFFLDSWQKLCGCVICCF